MLRCEQFAKLVGNHTFAHDVWVLRWFNYAGEVGVPIFGRQIERDRCAMLFRQRFAANDEEMVRLNGVAKLQAERLFRDNIRSTDLVDQERLVGTFDNMSDFMWGPSCGTKNVGWIDRK